MNHLEEAKRLMNHKSTDYSLDALLLTHALIAIAEQLEKLNNIGFVTFQSWDVGGGDYKREWITEVGREDK